VSATLTIPEVADLLGVSVNSAYEAAKSGELAGVPVIRIGAKRLVVPRAPLLAVLGLQDEGPTEAGPSTVSFGPDITGPTSQSHADNGTRRDSD
jgi:hypothetical protein